MLNEILLETAAPTHFIILEEHGFIHFKEALLEALRSQSRDFERLYLLSAKIRDDGNKICLLTNSKFRSLEFWEYTLVNLVNLFLVNNC